MGPQFGPSRHVQAVAHIFSLLFQQQQGGQSSYLVVKAVVDLLAVGHQMAVLMAVPVAD